MTQNVLLILQLHNESNEVRDRVFEQLKQKGWSDVQHISDTLTREIPEGQSPKAVINQDVRMVAEQIDLPEWSAVFSVSEQDPVALHT